VKRLAIIVAVATLWPALEQTPDVLSRIRQEGLERSKVQALFSTLTDRFGPRLAGTPVFKQSA
jgi:hypothetical protein